MPTAENAVSSLNIHRLRSVYLVPSDHPAPDAIRSKLDNVVRRKFGDAIASALSRALPDSTAGVWLIRSLTLNVDLNLDASEDRLAEIWARQAAVSVAMVLQDNAEADQVLHFSSSAIHLAHFLRGLADGSAWDKWYYRKFDGLRSLPLSAALRTAICREPLIGLEALQQISDSAARRVLSALTEHDAKWILNEIAGGDLPERQFSFEQIDPQSVFRAALDGENRAALHLYLRLSRQHPETAGAQLKTLVIALVYLTRCLQQPSLISALADRGVMAVLQMLDTERLLPLLGSPREWLESLAQSAELPTASSVAAHEARHTAAGGVFLLLPLLDAMPIAEATQQWPTLLDCAPASLGRWIILMKCFGTAGAGQVFHDPLVRDVLGVAPQIDASSLKDWQRSLTRKQLLDFQSQIARWQIANAIGTQHSISALVAGRKPQSLLCCDRSRISLLLALPNSPSSRKLLLETLSAWPTVADSADTPESYENQLAGPPLADADLQSLLRDLDFLRLPVAFSGSHRSDLMVSVAARALLRNFSGRLMGFSQSGLEYLFTNFLDFHASVQTESDQSTVRVGQPPLHIVLSLAGHESPVLQPELEARTVCIVSGLTMATDAAEFVRAEMARLDLLLHRQILRLRARYQLSLDEFRGLYISDFHVDSLIHDWRSSDSPSDFTGLDARATAMRQSNWDALPGDSPWKSLVAQLSLSSFEMDVILLAFAPQFDLKYEVLYAYLNNDVSKRWPTVDFPLQLFGSEPAERARLRSSLLPQSPLFRLGLLQITNETPTKPSWLAQGFSLNHSVAHYLLGHEFIDAALTAVLKPLPVAIGWSELRVSSAVQARLMRIPGLLRTAAIDAPICVLAGSCSAEKVMAAQAICGQLQTRLHELDLQAAQRSPDLIPALSRALSLEMLLRPAALYITNTACLWDTDPKLATDAWRLLLSVIENSRPIFIAANQAEQGIAALTHQELDRHERSRRCITIEFQNLQYHERRVAWEECLSHEVIDFPSSLFDDLASRFVFSHSQIQGTVRAAQQNHLLGEHSDIPLQEEDLLEAARAQSGHELGRLAPKVQLVHTWSDLVLPDVTLRQVCETASAIRHQHVVYAKWGFGQRLAASRGLKILFAGASGTGKTMTAAVVARDLGLDLYKIDLSAVVSKYIGETEKNLDRIFRAAHSSNAILFFDEADALFGKRSEVNDAHDRYANIEVAYLLQKMEEHDGVVILASNLSRNIDQAFSRRMHYVVEFPLPAEAQRDQLWRGMFPPDAPLSRDVDFAFLARQFPISGGDIRNVVLAAAFLAAQDGQPITMRHLIDAMRQQTIKRGKVPAAADFKQYHSHPALADECLITREPPRSNRSL